MRLTLVLLVGGLALAAIVYVVSGGKVILLPLLLILPFGLFRMGRRR